MSGKELLRCGIMFWLVAVLALIAMGISGCSLNLYSRSNEYVINQGSDVEPVAAPAAAPDTIAGATVNNMWIGFDAKVDSESNAGQESRASNKMDTALSQGAETAANTAGGALEWITNSLTQHKTTTGDAAAVAEDLLDAGKRSSVLTPKKEVVVPAGEEDAGEPAGESAEQKSVTEYGIYHGLTNGDRPTWYFSKKMDAYPDNFDVVIPGCKTLSVENNGVRDDQGGGYLVKQSDVPGRGMVVLAAKGCASTVARL